LPVAGRLASLRLVNPVEGPEILEGSKNSLLLALPVLHSFLTAISSGVGSAKEDTFFFARDH